MDNLLFPASQIMAIKEIVPETPEPAINLYIIIGLRIWGQYTYWKYRGTCDSLEKANQFVEREIKMNTQIKKFKIYQLK